MDTPCDTKSLITYLLLLCILLLQSILIWVISNPAARKLLS
jgi:hypothetical protein